MTDDATFDPNEIMLTLVENGSFNCFDGRRTVEDLREHRELWDSVIFARPGFGITLRDMPDKTWSADTLYLLTDKARALDLVELANGWQTDSLEIKKDKEVSSFLGSGRGDEQRVVLVLWWD